jgi:hypothetical protein
VLIGAWSQQAPRPPAPADVVASVIEAFRTHEIVAIPDPHRNTGIQNAVLTIIRAPQFAATVDDIVVEFGNARYQDVVDRFERGEDVRYEDLRRSWLDTTQPNPSSDTPQAEELLRAVRLVNETAQPQHQIRVLLGDPPIDWNQVKAKSDLMSWLSQRETYPADLIRREVLAKHRRALVVYGIGHLQRKNPQANFDSSGPAASLVSLLEDDGTTRVFNIGLMFDPPAGVDVERWRVPSIARLRGTSLGASDVTYNGPRVALQNGRIVPVPREAWRTMRMEDQFDALLYLGPRESWSNAMVSPALCADAAYLAMRSARMALAEWQSDTIADFCGNPPATAH